MNVFKAIRLLLQGLKAVSDFLGKKIGVDSESNLLSVGLNSAIERVDRLSGALSGSLPRGVSIEIEGKYGPGNDGPKPPEPGFTVDPEEVDDHLGTGSVIFRF